MSEEERNGQNLVQRPQLLLFIEATFPRLEKKLSHGLTKCKGTHRNRNRHLKLDCHILSWYLD